MFSIFFKKNVKPRHLMFPNYTKESLLANKLRVMLTGVFRVIINKS